MATKKTNSLLQQQEDGKTHENCLSVHNRTPRYLDLYQTKNLEHIDTQKLTLGKIMRAISDENIQIIGIYGLGGVGKTTLAKEVAKKVKNLFVDIVFITVSHTIDAKMIQEKVEVAAKRIIKGEKVLIILDDIWEDILLPDMGIPCGDDYINCKILLTSRSKNVCEAMNVESNICVNTLTEKEAWILFKRVAGERLETDVKLRKIAEKVTQECGGLPLIIQAVGKALKNKRIDLWEAALDRLQNHAPLDIAPEIRKAFTHLKLSYDYLESEEAKSRFLLCCMFKEDGIIELKLLAEYGMGLGIFQNLDGITDAVYRVQIAVETLTSCFLLLPEEEQNRVRMHDVVRDVALLIGKDKFLVKSGEDLKEWKPRNNISASFTKISLMDNKICELPNRELHFPLVDTLLVQKNELSYVPDEFFRDMREVKVLDMSDNYIRSLPQSLKLLTKLITLNLSDNMHLKEIAIFGELKGLEVLKLRNTAVQMIPEEIGQLTNLRLLNVDCCIFLSFVTPGVISNLTWLEELYIRVSKNGVRYGPTKYGVQLDLMEISNLKSLKTLHLSVPPSHFFPQGAQFEALTEFFIQIGEDRRDNWYAQRSYIKRRLQISDSNIKGMMPFKKLIQVSDAILLRSIKDLENILPGLYKESFNELKCIQLMNCDNVSCLVKTRDQGAIHAWVSSKRKSKEKFFSQVEVILLRHLSCLEVLWDCPHQYVSFHNLQTLKFLGCSSLLMLFPVSVAQGLANLKYMEIWECDSLVEVISAEDEQTEGIEFEQTVSSETKSDIYDTDIVFPCLTSISFRILPNLKSFYSGYSTIKYPSLESIVVDYCPSMERWGCGVHEIPKINLHHQGTPCSINDVIAVHHKTNERVVMNKRGRRVKVSSITL